MTNKRYGQVSVARYPPHTHPPKELPVLSMPRVRVRVYVRTCITMSYIYARIFFYIAVTFVISPFQWLFLFTLYCRVSSFPFSLFDFSIFITNIVRTRSDTRTHIYRHIHTFVHRTLVNTLERFTRPTHALTPSLKPRRCSVIVYPSVSLLYITYRRTPARRSASFVNCDRSSRENSKSFVGKKSSQFRDSINVSRIGDVSEEISSNRRKSRTNFKSLKRQLIPIGVSLEHYAKST